MANSERSLLPSSYRAPNALPYDLETAWSDIGESTRVRWLTPTFHKVGTVILRKDRGLRVLFDGEDGPTNIPDARWYFVQRRRGDRENQLCAVKRSVRSRRSRVSGKSLPTDHMISSHQASADFGVGPKELRRWLRSGRVLGAQREGRWYVDEVSLGKYLAERR